MRFLLVESDKLLAENLAAALKAYSHQLEWQVDLQSALESLDTTQPCAIIIDMNLAGRSGVELLYELRSYPEWQNLPIYIWSDAFSKEAIPWEIFGELNVSAYHYKPTTSILTLVESLTAQPSPA